jgi:hypothetical protein
MQQLAREYRRAEEIASAPRRAGARGRRSRMRQRLGRSLIGLGVWLAGDPRLGRPVRPQHARGAVSRAEPLRSLARS